MENTWETEKLFQNKLLDESDVLQGSKEQNLQNLLMGGDGVKEKVNQIPSKIRLRKGVTKREPVHLMCIHANSYGRVKTRAS